MKIAVKENSNTSEIKVNPELEKYKQNNPFPEKLERANQMLKTAKLPESKHKR